MSPKINILKAIRQSEKNGYWFILPYVIFFPPVRRIPSRLLFYPDLPSLEYCHADGMGRDEKFSTVVFGPAVFQGDV